jgi:hypothetical protein
VRLWPSSRRCLLSRCIRVHGACGAGASRQDETTTRRHDANLCESLRRTLPVGVAALRAVKGVRIGRITSGVHGILTACDSPDPHSYPAGPTGPASAPTGRAVDRWPAACTKWALRRCPDVPSWPEHVRRVVVSSCRRAAEGGPAAGGRGSERRSKRSCRLSGVHLTHASLDGRRSPTCPSCSPRARLASFRSC